MLNKLLLFALVGLVVAGGAYQQGTSLTLRRNQRNVLNFVCGGYGADGSPSHNPQESYRYRFSGQPSWLTVSGSSLIGTPPSYDNGPWYVSVSYSGSGYPAAEGSSTYKLSCDNSNSIIGGYLQYAPKPAPAVNCDPVTYTHTSDDVAASYTVLVPIVTTQTRTVYDKLPDTITHLPPVSCDSQQDALNNANSGLAGDQANLDALNAQLEAAKAALANLQNQIAAAQALLNTDQANIQSATSALADCKTRQAAAAIPIVTPGQTVARTETYNTTSYASVVVQGGYNKENCDSVPVTGRGRGIISAVNSNCVTIFGVGQVNFGDCTRKNYRAGRYNFGISDTVSYETYQWGGQTWARNLQCQ